jgi:hypothetical protein
MFNCYLHGWSSLDDPCPRCHPIITVTTTDYVANPTEQPIEDRIEVMDICEITVHKDFPAFTIKEGSGVKVFEHGYHLFTSHKIAEEKLPLIKSAIEKILNNE